MRVVVFSLLCWSLLLLAVWSFRWARQRIVSLDSFNGESACYDRETEPLNCGSVDTQYTLSALSMARAIPFEEMNSYLFSDQCFAFCMFM